MPASCSDTASRWDSLRPFATEETTHKENAMTTQTIATAITYRRMTESDLAGAHVLSQAVRWPHRLEDWQFVLRLGIGFVAVEGDTVVGTALCW
jgi:hypothetical protein